MKKKKEIDEIDEALASWKELITWAKEDKRILRPLSDNGE
jgi:hypothetical protein